MTDAHHHLLRLLHLVSPTLPTGAFAYSQGLEWAVETGWVNTAADLEAWLGDLVGSSLCRLEVPLLVRMMSIFRDGRTEDLAHWCSLLLASRETSELRQEERDRGRAMASLLDGLGIPVEVSVREHVATSQLAGFALAAAHWRIPASEAATGYLWSWLENQVLTGIKIIPLGQTDGHRILMRLDGALKLAVVRGLEIEDDEIGASSPALAIAGSRHETQYTRLYRS